MGESISIAGFLEALVAMGPLSRLKRQNVLFCGVSG